MRDPGRGYGSGPLMIGRVAYNLVRPRRADPRRLVGVRGSSASAEGKDPAAASSDAAADATITRPPLPVRVALVSSATALATPAFPALGFLYLVGRAAVRDDSVRRSLEGRVGPVVSFACWTLVPALYGGPVASLILPCALGNAAVAGTVYGALDLAVGGPGTGAGRTALRTPWIAGGGVGAATGYLGPNFAYGPILESLYGLDGASASLERLMSYPLANEVCVATGAAAGLLMYPLLYLPTEGVPGVRWELSSGLALAATAGALGYVYYMQKDSGLPLPEGSYLSPDQADLVRSILRHNRASEHIETYSPGRDRFLGPEQMRLDGEEMAEACRAYSGGGKKAVFNDRLLAFAYNYWDSTTADRHPDGVVEIPTADETSRRQGAVATSDALAAALLLGEGRSGEGTGRILRTAGELARDGRGRAGVPSAEAFEDAASALEVLMSHRIHGRDLPADSTEGRLEDFVRRQCPGVMLYPSDETFARTSVETQLRGTGWKAPDEGRSTSRWEEASERERMRTVRRRVVIAATGGAALLAIAGLMLGRD